MKGMVLIFEEGVSLANIMDAISGSFRTIFDEAGGSLYVDRNFVEHDGGLYADKQKETLSQYVRIYSGDTDDSYYDPEEMSIIDGAIGAHCFYEVPYGRIEIMRDVILCLVETFKLVVDTTDGIIEPGEAMAERWAVDPDWDWLWPSPTVEESHPAWVEAKSLVGSDRASFVSRVLGRFEGVNMVLTEIEGRTYVAMDEIGICLVSKNSDSIDTVQISDAEVHHFSLPMGLSLDDSREMARSKLGVPTQSGKHLGVNPLTGCPFNAWDVFLVEGVRCHIEYQPNERSIALVSLSGGSS